MNLCTRLPISDAHSMDLTSLRANSSPLAICGLLVSFTQVLDNVAKCFCSALTRCAIALLDSAMKLEVVRVAGVILTGLALEQYNISS